MHEYHINLAITELFYGLGRGFNSAFLKVIRDADGKGAVFGMMADDTLKEIIRTKCPREIYDAIGLRNCSLIRRNQPIPICSLRFDFDKDSFLSIEDIEDCHPDFM